METSVQTTDRRRAAVRETIARLRASLPAAAIDARIGSRRSRRSLSASPRAPSCSPRAFPGRRRPARHGLPPLRGRRLRLRALRLRRAAGQGAAAAQPHHLGGDLRRLRRRAQRLLRAHRQPRDAGRRRCAKTGELTVSAATPSPSCPTISTPSRIAGESLAAPALSTAAASSTCPSGSSSSTRGRRGLRGFPAKPDIATPVVAAAELKAMLDDGGELALLDVREEGVFAQGHLLLAVSLPLSRLETRIGRARAAAARRASCCATTTTRLAQRAAAKLRGIGYRDVSVLAGGIGAWRRRATSCSAASTCRARRSASSSSTTTARRTSRPRR